MKKHISVLMACALLLCLCFAACGTGGQGSSTTDARQSSEDTSVSQSSTDPATTPAPNPDAKPFTPDDITALTKALHTVQDYVDLVKKAERYRVESWAADASVHIAFVKAETDADAPALLELRVMECENWEAYSGETAKVYDASSFPAELLPLEAQADSIYFGESAIPAPRGLGAGASKQDVLASYPNAAINGDPNFLYDITYLRSNVDPSWGDIGDFKIGGQIFPDADRIVFVYSQFDDPEEWKTYDRLTYELDNDVVSGVYYDYFTDPE